MDIKGFKSKDGTVYKYDYDSLANVPNNSDPFQDVNPVAKTEDMTQPVGVDENGQLWVAPIGTSSGGGSGGNTETTTHGIVWDLVNVTSSNSVVSVSDGASLVAVLTPADGYTLGDVIVTMGGEALTGVWNADTATVTIASVTGDVVISCAGAEHTEYEETPVEITWVNGSDSSGVFTPSATTIAYVSHEELIDATVYDLKINMPYDADYCTEGSAGKTLKVYLYSDSDQVNCIGMYDITTGEITTGLLWKTLEWDTDLIIPCGYYVRIFMNRDGCSSNALLLSYFRNHTVAYQVTPTTKTEGISVAQAVDNDYLQDYGVSTLSLTTEVEDTTTFEGVLETAKNAWMVEYGGSVNKIPLIIHTDQHGHLNRGETVGDAFDSISSMVNWYDISKVINLGDTANSYDSPDDLTAGSTTLESYLDAMSKVPYSKRIEIFGNHDLAYFVDGVLTFIDSDQFYLQPYFRNIFARKVSNNGYFAVKDDNFNIKYVVISGFEVDKDIGNGNNYIMSSKQIAWMIEELEKEDGYDVIILSHVPLWKSATETNPIDGTTSSTSYAVDAAIDLDALYAARKNKTSGSVTDRYGIAHNYDFSNCTGELLCSLHGHNHSDGYAYTGDALLSATFQNFYATPRCLYFVLIDRENRKLNVWKVDNTPQYQNYQIPLDKPAE